MSIIVDRLSVVEYDPHWPKQFESDAKKIAKLIGGVLISLEHVGATAIAGLAAAERIDFLAQVSSIEHCKALTSQLTDSGYSPIEEHFSLRSMAFRRKQPYPPHVILIYENQDPQAKKIIDFRDYMRSEKKVTSFFSRAKKNLTDKYRGNIHEYLQHRSALFSAIDIKALKYAQNEPAKIPKNRLFYPSSKEGIDALSLDNFYFFLHWPWLYSQKAHAIRSYFMSYTIASSLEESTCHEINTIFGVSQRSDTLALAIEELKALFQDKSQPCTWWITQRDTPEDLFKKAHQEGFTYQETAHLLTCFLSDAHTLPQAILEGAVVKSVSSPQEMIAYCSTLTSDQLSAVARGPKPDEISNGSLKKAISTLEAFSSIHEKAYGYGQPMEFITLEINGKVAASVTLIYYAGCVGFYNWSYLSGHENTFLNLLLSQMQRCYQENWRYFSILSSEEMAPSFVKLGFQPTHPIHRHHLESK